MLEKWKVVMCTHIREQPSSGGLLLRPSAITSLPLGYVAGKTLHFCHDDVDTFFFLLLIVLAKERGTRADENVRMFSSSVVSVHPLAFSIHRSSI